MHKKTAKEEHDGAKGTISHGYVKRVESCPTPMEALDMISEREPIAACAIIDKMSPLGGAIIFALACLKAQDESNPKRKYFLTVIERAEQLDLAVTKGTTHARNEVYRLAGTFLP